MFLLEVNNNYSTVVTKSMSGFFVCACMLNMEVEADNVLQSA